MKQYSARITSNQQVMEGMVRSTGKSASGSWLMRLKCPGICGEAAPGQFVMVRCGEDSVLPRPFSLHRVYDGGEIALLYTVWEDGKGTGWLSRRQAGEKIALFGPLGNGFSVPPDARRLLLVAGGMGIAPLRFLADATAGQGKQVTLLMGAPSAGQLLPLEPGGIDTVKATEDGSGGHKGLVTELMADYIDRADQIFACGPAGMYRAMTGMRELQGKPVQVSLETRMACGLGTCYGCTIRTRYGPAQVCRDGPVFNLRDVNREALTPA